MERDNSDIRPWKQIDEALQAAASVCKTCKGYGWVVWVYPEKEPRPTYWFRKGPHGERPIPCDDCEAIQ